MTLYLLQLTTLRGCILEDAIPSSSRLSNTKGLSPKDVLDYLLPPDLLNPACLKAAMPGPKTAEQLCKLDEQGVRDDLISPKQEMHWLRAKEIKDGPNSQAVPKILVHKK